MIEFLKYLNKSIFYLKLPYAVFLWFLRKTKIISLEDFKIKFLSHFFQGFDQNQIETTAHSFSKEYVKALRPVALNFLKNINKENSEIYIVSASLDIWMKPISNLLDVNLICTDAKFINGKFIGFDSKNCKGEEKVNRINKELDLKKFNKILAFGDTPPDKPMLKLAQESFYKPFRG